MKWYCTSLEQDTLGNANFRKVVYTGKHMQLVLMSLLPLEAIGLETHHENDQFFRFEQGQGKCVVDGTEYLVEDGSALIVPAWAEHNIINTSTSEPLRFYTIYAPSHHKDGIVRATKQEAATHEAEFDGVTTE